jgi:hypothetical protein
VKHASLLVIFPGAGRRLACASWHAIHKGGGHVAVEGGRFGRQVSPCFEHPRKSRSQEETL